MAGKSNKPQIPMSDIHYLPPADKPNQEIQLNFIRLIKFRQRRFFILFSIDRYSRWPAACIYVYAKHQPEELQKLSWNNLVY